MRHLRRCRVFSPHLLNAQTGPPFLHKAFGHLLCLRRTGARREDRRAEPVHRLGKSSALIRYPRGYMPGRHKDARAPVIHHPVTACPAPATPGRQRADGPGWLARSASLYLLFGTPWWYSLVVGGSVGGSVQLIAKFKCRSSAELAVGLISAFPSFVLRQQAHSAPC